jgi:hypothetical protein
MTDLLAECLDLVEREAELFPLFARVHTHTVDFGLQKRHLYVSKDRWTGPD